MRMPVIRVFIFVLKNIKYNISHYWLRALAFSKFGVLLPAGTYILYPENITIGKNFTAGPFSQLMCQDPDKGSQIIMGNNISINHHVFINADCGGKITIGDNVIIGPMTILRASNHNFDDPDAPIRSQGHKPGAIHIEDDVWIGASVVVLPNVTIGRSSIIGAGCVVTKDIPAYSVAVGNPAKVIRSRKENIHAG